MKYSEYISSLNEDFKDDVNYKISMEVMKLLQNKKVNFGNFMLSKYEYVVAHDFYKITLKCAHSGLKDIITGYDTAKDAWNIYLDKDGSLLNTEVTYKGQLYFDLNDSTNKVYGLELERDHVKALYDVVASFTEITRNFADKLGKKIAKFKGYQEMFR